MPLDDAALASLNVEATPSLFGKGVRFRTARPVRCRIRRLAGNRISSSKDMLLRDIKCHVLAEIIKCLAVVRRELEREESEEGRW